MSDLLLILVWHPWLKFALVSVGLGAVMVVLGVRRATRRRSSARCGGCGVVTGAKAAVSLRGGRVLVILGIAVAVGGTLLATNRSAWPFDRAYFSVRWPMYGFSPRVEGERHEVGRFALVHYRDRRRAVGRANAGMDRVVLYRDGVEVGAVEPAAGEIRLWGVSGFFSERGDGTRESLFDADGDSTPDFVVVTWDASVSPALATATRYEFEAGRLVNRGSVSSRNPRVVEIMDGSDPYPRFVSELDIGLKDYLRVIERLRETVALEQIGRLGGGS